MWKVYSTAAGVDLEEQLMGGRVGGRVLEEEKQAQHRGGEAELLYSYEADHVYVLKYNLSCPN